MTDPGIPIVVQALFLATILFNGLLAGLYFAFACAVTPALRSVDDSTYIQTFRLINQRILNPWFLSVFFLAPLTSLAMGVIWVVDGPFANAGLFFAGLVCALSTFFITVLRNVPLNNALENTPITAVRPAGHVRARFESTWNGWNLLRTLTGVASVLLFVLSFTQAL